VFLTDTAVFTIRMMEGPLSLLLASLSLLLGVVVLIRFLFYDRNMNASGNIMISLGFRGFVSVSSL